MPIYYVTADGPQQIPPDVLEQGDAATAAYIAQQGWQPPPPPVAAATTPAAPAAAPAPITDEED